MRRRSHELDHHRTITSGGQELAQLRDEVKARDTDERQQLLKDLEFKIEIPAVIGLAMKSALCLPWNRMRAMKR